MRKILSVILVTAVLVSLLVMGVNAKSRDEVIKEEAHLVMYLLGNPPRDIDLVMEKLNILTRRDLNTTLEVRYLSWGDWKNKYPLLFTTGEQFDLIYTADWALYHDMAEKGAFMALDDLLPKFAPKTWANMPGEAWNQVTYQDNIYMVPYNFKAIHSCAGFIYREDLRKKYGVPEITNLSTFMAYLQALKENNSDIIPLNASYGAAENWLPGQLMSCIEDKDLISTGVRGVPFLKINNNKELYIPAFNEELFKEKRDIMREFYLKGYWSKNVMSNKQKSIDSFVNGTSGACFSRPVDVNSYYSQIKSKHPDWELGVWFPHELKTKVFLRSFLGNGMAINRNAKHPKRALMLLDKLHNDPEYAYLTRYGIKGKHYELNEKGQYVLPEGLSMADSGFTPDSMSPWGWREHKYTLISGDSWPEYNQIEKELFAKGIQLPDVGFKPSLENISAEVSALKQVSEQYAAPMNFGLYPVDEGYSRLIKEMKNAGIDKVYEEIKRQWEEFLEEQ